MRGARRPVCLAAALWLAGCAAAPQPQDVAAARRNAASAYALPIDLFGRPEAGWAVYAPRVEQTIKSAAPADSPSFARALRRWRLANGLVGTGEVDALSLQAMKQGWQAARPFTAVRAKGVCPDAPPATALAALQASESYGARPLRLRPRALAAYRAMVRYARRTQPALRLRPELLQVFSAYRSPERDAARCATEGNCQGVVRAACSAHRTGLALDMVLDTATGAAVDSSADANRLAMARGFAYRWLLAEAPSFGFVNYAFEPWHWEWTGERP